MTEQTWSARVSHLRGALKVQQEADAVLEEALQVRQHAMARANVIISDAESTAEAIEAEAKADAERTRAGATAEATQLLDDARGNVEQIHRDAARAEREAGRRRDEILAAAEAEAAGVAQQLADGVGPLRTAVDQARAEVAAATKVLTELKAVDIEPLTADPAADEAAAPESDPSATAEGRPRRFGSRR